MKRPTAFPRAGHEWEGMEWVPAPSQDGMYLRDYFAAKAMAQLINQIDKLTEKQLMEYDVHEAVAIASYVYADAMLKERQK